MAESELDVVTGAFSFTGKYIARRLLESGCRVKTLTGHPNRDHPFGDAIPAVPFHFDDRPALAASLAGATTLFNTYWIRFEQGEATFDRAVANTEALFSAARSAGVRRIVHVSIAHADENSPFPYFRGKGQVERLLRESGLSYAILRPTVLFGSEGILFNNIAWLLRRFPIFAVAGNGSYRLQPVSVEDLADLAVKAAREADNSVVHAAGPEFFSFDRLVREMAEAIGRSARLLHLPPAAVLLITGRIGRLVGDVLLTRDEVGGLLDGLLLADGPPAGWSSFRQWLRQQANTIGTAYFSEVQRHFQ